MDSFYEVLVHSIQDWSFRSTLIGRKCVASGWLRVGWIASEKNLADLFTKVLQPRPRNALISCMLNRWLGKAKSKDEN